MARKRSRSRGSSGGSVSRRTVLGAVALGGAGLLGLRETGAFSAGTGDRVFSTGTAGDDTAFLGIAPGDPNEYDELAVSGTDGETVPILTLTNNSGEALNSITATSIPSGSPGINLTNIDTPLTIPPGDSAAITANLVCKQSGSDVPVELQIDVSGPEGSVTAIRELSVTCEAPDYGDGKFIYSDGPGRNPPGTPPNSVAFELQNIGDVTVPLDGFSVLIDSPGRDPDRFERFEIDTPDGNITGNGGNVGTDLSHDTYEIAPDETARYVLETFDRNLSSLGEFELTLIAEDGTRFQLDPVSL